MELQDAEARFRDDDFTIGCVGPTSVGFDAAALQAVAVSLNYLNDRRERRLKMSLLHRGFFIVLLLSFALVLPGCQQEGTAEKAGEKVDQAAEKVSEQAQKAGEAVSEKAEKAAEYMDDAAITAKIKMDIMSDPLLKVSQISVTTTNGAVNLSGVVESQQSIDRAMEIVGSVKSVKSVENNLDVKAD